MGDELERAVVALVVETAPRAAFGAALRTDLRLRGDLGFDSLRLVGLLMRLADELGVDPDDLVETLSDAPMTTVGDLVALAARVEQRGLSA